MIRFLSACIAFAVFAAAAFGQQPLGPLPCSCSGYVYETATPPLQPFRGALVVLKFSTLDQNGVWTAQQGDCVTDTNGYYQRGFNVPVNTLAVSVLVLDVDGQLPKTYGAASATAPIPPTLRLSNTYVD